MSGDQVKRGKPAPDIFIETAKQLNVSPSDCIVFEDSQNGVIAAKAADMKVIAIPTQYTIDHDLSKADLIVASLKDVTWNLISGLN